MRRLAWVVAAALAGALVVHEVLLRVIAGAGSEAVGVALGPGTPLEDVALMGSFVALRVGLCLLGPGLAVVLAVLLMPGRAGPAGDEG